MHTWGDKWLYWDDLNAGISRIIHIARKWGRIGLHGKEKYGTFRDDGFDWDGTLHGLVFPGYVYIQYPKWYYYIDKPIIVPFLTLTGVAFLVRWYQRTIWNYAIQSTCKLYPKTIQELTVMLNRYEWITPGIFGPLDGAIIHFGHWLSSKFTEEQLAAEEYEQWVTSKLIW